PSLSASGIDVTSIGLHAATSWVRYCPVAMRIAPSTKACSAADGVDRMSRPTPPTEPDAIMMEIARPSSWSLAPTTMPSRSSVEIPASTSAAFATAYIASSSERCFASRGAWIALPTTATPVANCILYPLWSLALRPHRLRGGERRRIDRLGLAALPLYDHELRPGTAPVRLELQPSAGEIPRCTVGLVEAANRRGHFFGIGRTRFFHRVLEDPH